MQFNKLHFAAVFIAYKKQRVDMFAKKKILLKVSVHQISALFVSSGRLLLLLCAFEMTVSLETL